MTWLQKYRVRNFVRNSIWLMPSVGMVAGLIVIRALHWLESASGWESGFQPEGARAVLGTLAASMFSLVVFVSSTFLVVLQLASAQLSPRVVGIIFRDPVTKVSIAAFMFTFTVTIATLARIDSTVPQLTIDLAVYSSIASLGLFLYLVDHLSKALRPSGALRIVSRVGKSVINDVYPRRFCETPLEPALSPSSMPPDRECPIIVASLRDGVILACDFNGLIAIARAAECTIELMPQVGNFVATGDPLFHLSKGRKAVKPKALYHSVALGQERTIKQDPTFIFRILVDIASKALSPAINDPTTAVLALDQIHHLLRIVGGRNLDEGVFKGTTGEPGFIYRTPDWEDFVRLAVTEIRLFGASSIQVARRLRAMLENLIKVLPEQRQAVLRYEFSLLQKTAENSFSEPEDRAMAMVSDFQGVGGSQT